MGQKITEPAAAGASALEALRSLRQQHAEFGQRLESIAQDVETEIETLKAEAQASAAELEETRAELVELRAALETEKMKRATAETRIGKLETHIRLMKLACDKVLTEDDPTSPTSKPAAEVEAVQDAPPSTPLSEALGVAAPVLAALAMLTAMKGAASPEEMLRILLFRELEQAGLMPEVIPESDEVGAGGEEPPNIRC